MKFEKEVVVTKIGVAGSKQETVYGLSDGTMVFENDIPRKDIYKVEES